MQPVYEPGPYADKLGDEGLPGLIEAELAARGFSSQLRIDDAGTYYPPTVGQPMKVYIVIDGSLSVWVNREYYLLNPGSRMIVPAGAVHWARSGADGCRYFLGLMQSQGRQRRAAEADQG